MIVIVFSFSDPTVPRYECIPVDASAIFSGTVIIVEGEKAKDGKSRRVRGICDSGFLS